jgi:predicted secreted Zn-dependent protease
MRLLAFALSLGLAGAACAQPARPAAAGGDGVRLAVSVRPYEVTGRSAQDLLAAMQERGPRHGDRSFFGLTTSELRYAYRYGTRGGRCSADEVAVTVNLTVTLPQWTPPRGTPYALEREWRVFERALRGHEDDHRRIAEEEAATILRALGALRAPTCEALDAEARRQAEDIRARYAVVHQDFDRRTSHGRTQGAVWPRE